MDKVAHSVEAKLQLCLSICALRWKKKNYVPVCLKKLAGVIRHNNPFIIYLFP